LTVWLGVVFYVLRPLNLISSSLERNDQNKIAALLKDRSEFGDISKLIKNFHQQKEELISTVSEYQDVSKALVESQHFLQNISDSLPGILYLLDLNSRKCIFFNSATEKILGFKPEELIQLQDLLPDTILHPQDKEILNSNFAKYKTMSDGESLECEYRVKNAIHDWLCLHVHEIVFMRNEDNSPSQILGIAIDFTQRKKQEKEQMAIMQVANGIRTANTFDDLLPVLLDEMMKLMNADGAALIMKENEHVMTVKLGYGKWRRTTGITIPEEDKITKQVFVTRETYINNQVKPGELKFAHSKLIENPSVAISTPLISQDSVVGILWLCREESFSEDQLKILYVLNDIAASAIQRVSLNEATQQRLKKMTALRTINITITTSMELTLILNVFLDQIITKLQVTAANIYLMQPENSTLVMAARRGFQSNLPNKTKFHLGEDYTGRAALERQIIHVPIIYPLESSSLLNHIVEREGFTDYYAVPLVAKGQVKGVLETFHRYPFKHDSEWIEFLDVLAAEASVAIDNAEIFQQLQQSNKELTIAYDTTIEGWSRALELRDKETQGHSRRVTELTLKLARYMKVDSNQFDSIRRGALLHDIGKMGIPDQILLKTGPLNESEWSVMKKHPEYAFEMLSSIEFLVPAVDIPYCHHEKWDGTGYPRGLKGEEIPLAARIFAIVDVWDALSNDRPYQKAWEINKIFDFIQEQSGKYFDPLITESFCKMMAQSEEKVLLPG
ncbi:MAG: HD domain-containing phosphohydrolase, partial [Anaerolineaceae bacterium]